MVENKKINVQIEEINFRESLSEVLESISTLVIDTKAIINVYFFKFENILFNKAYLKSIFLNLLTNSIKYTKPDQAPNINITTRKSNGVHQLIFSDDGLGFDMDKVKNKIFGLYEKFHSHIDSNGIGLYLVYNHVTSLGGKITVESEINKGAKFIISFKY